MSRSFNSKLGGFQSSNFSLNLRTASMPSRSNSRSISETIRAVSESCSNSRCPPALMIFIVQSGSRCFQNFFQRLAKPFFVLRKLRVALDVREQRVFGFNFGGLKNRVVLQRLGEHFPAN